MKKRILAIGIMAISAAFASELVIIDNGKSDYVIAIPLAASIQERFVGNELASHLEKISGVKLEIAKENILPTGKKIISIGNTSFSQKAGIDQSTLQDEEIIIRTTSEENLILSGGRLRGTMYAVYDFLEKQLGCHWFDEYTFEIPKKERIAIPELNLQYHPYFMFRRISASIAVDQTTWKIFILRNQGSDGPYLCGYDAIGGPTACHSFWHYAKNFPKDDIEFYSMDEKGVRQKPAGSSGPDFCLSNSKVVKNVTDSLKINILKDRKRYATYGFPPPPIYDISQNDGSQKYFCLCPSCQEIVKKHGAQSGLLLHFINQIADNIKDEFPDVYIQTFAYNQGEDLPKDIVPRENVFIRYCTTTDIFGAPFAASANKPLQKQLEGWSRISENIGIWMYTYFFLDPFAMPYVSANQFGRDFKYLAANNVKTIYMENHEYYKLSFFALQRWLAYQLMQDPQRDADKLIKTFMDGYYGGGSKAIMKYYDYLVELQPQLTYNIFSKEAKTTTRPYLTAEFFRKVDTLFEEAEKACEPSSRQLMNIHRERAIVDSAYLNLREKLKYLPLDENIVLDRYEKYRMELLDTLVPKDKRNSILAKIANDVRKLRFGKEIAKAMKEPPGETSIPEVKDNDWNKARVIKNWSENYGLPSNRKLTARLMHDEKDLKIRLEENNIGRQLYDGPGEVWSGDDWELHFTGNPAKGNLRMIAISPRKGSRALEVGRKPGGMPDGKTSALTEYATKVDSKIEGDSWIVNVVIPLDRLIPGGAVKAGGKIYMNIFRGAVQLGSAQAWSPTFQDSFHIPWRLGKVWILPYPQKGN
ncbi:MAG: DUF4838 domain-containing protein [Lentisphaeria bacterium]